jgi:hypothetical protein
MDLREAEAMISVPPGLYGRVMFTTVVDPDALCWIAPRGTICIWVDQNRKVSRIEFLEWWVEEEGLWSTVRSWWHWWDGSRVFTFTGESARDHA